MNKRLFSIAFVLFSMISVSHVAFGDVPEVTIPSVEQLTLELANLHNAHEALQQSNAKLQLENAVLLAYNKQLAAQLVHLSSQVIIGG